jgi:hypothetical protein
MVQLTRRQAEDEETLPPEALTISPKYVQITTQSIALLQDMTRTLLKRDRDYGRTPGTVSDGLWDPGASLIIAGFNCYAGQRRVLKLVDDEDRMTVILEVPLISRQSGREVGSGVGAASAMETKYKYRWLYPSELKEMGYTEEQISTFKTDKRRHPGKHRTDNLERGELLNTLVKQASKRAEVDAAEALPGVASTLRELFNREPDKGEGPRWQRFWGETQRMGYSEQEVHDKLNVTSMNDWLKNRHSLDEALDILRGTEEKPTTPPDPKKKQPKGKRDLESIKTIDDLLKACHEDFNMQPKDVYAELNVSGRAAIAEPPKECYRKIAVVKEGPPS